MDREDERLVNEIAAALEKRFAHLNVKCVDCRAKLGEPVNTVKLNYGSCESGAAWAIVVGMAVGLCLLHYVLSG